MIIEPANGSPTTRAPARARTAMMSTLSWRRLIAATVQASDATRPSRGAGVPDQRPRPMRDRAARRHRRSAAATWRKRRAGLPCALADASRPRSCLTEAVGRSGRRSQVPATTVTCHTVEPGAFDQELGPRTGASASETRQPQQARTRLARNGRRRPDWMQTRQPGSMFLCCW